jgi:hypothetical protein
MVWEREIYINLLLDHIEAQKQTQNNNPFTMM